MIRLFEKDETEFSSLGICVLKDATRCVVTETINGEYELEMEYPINGSHFNDIQNERILLVKPNMEDEPQPFRIYLKSEPIDGLVTFNAAHIVYDGENVVIKPFSEVSGVQNAFDAALENQIGHTPFSLSSEIISPVSYLLESPCNLKAFLMGSSKSIIDIFGGELKYNKYNVSLVEQRGNDTGVSIRYGKNMSDFVKEFDTSNKFTSIFPYFSQNIQEQETVNEKFFSVAYIAEGNPVPFSSNWLSYSSALSAFIPKVTNAPIQIDSEDSPFYKSVLLWKNDLSESSIQDAYVVPDTEPFSKEWLTKTAGKASLTPSQGIIYRVLSDGEFKNKTYRWSSVSYEETNDNDILFIGSYIRSGAVEYSSDWLSLSSAGAALTPELGNIYEIKSEGAYKGKRYRWNGSEYKVTSDKGTYYIPNPQPQPTQSRSETRTIEKTYYITLISKDAYIVPGAEEYSKDWLSETIGGESLTPDTNTLYKICSEGSEHYGKFYYWSVSEYIDLDDSNVDGTGLIYIGDPSERSPLKTGMLDTSPHFSDLSSVPTVKDIYDFALEQVKDNPKLVLGSRTIDVSFVLLSDSDEYAHLKNLERVSLGDIVTVEHSELRLKEKMRVITTRYNAILDRYEEITLGQESEKLTDNAVCNSDAISALTNDRGYTDQTTVNKLITKTITADFLEAINARLTSAQIEDLQVTRINCPGIIEASQIVIDELVASMLTADNAYIKEALVAGEIEVIGNITATSGTIGGCEIIDGTLTASKIVCDQVVYDSQTELQDMITNYVNATYINTLGMTADFIRAGTIDADISINLGAEKGSCVEAYITEVLLTRAYILPDSDEYSSDWLSLSPDGLPLLPGLESVYVVEIQGTDTNFCWNGSEYIHYIQPKNSKWLTKESGSRMSLSPLPGQVYINNDEANSPKYHYDALQDLYIKYPNPSLTSIQYTVSAYISESQTVEAFSKDWLTSVQGGPPLVPTAGDRYRIQNDASSGPYSEHIFIWDGEKYTDTTYKEGWISRGSMPDENVLYYVPYTSEFELFSDKTYIWYSQESRFIALFNEERYNLVLSSDGGITLSAGGYITAGDGAFMVDGNGNVVASSMTLYSRGQKIENSFETDTMLINERLTVLGELDFKNASIQSMNVRDSLSFSENSEIEITTNNIQKKTITIPEELVSTGITETTTDGLESRCQLILFTNGRDSVDKATRWSVQMYYWFKTSDNVHSISFDVVLPANTSTVTAWSPWIRTGNIVGYKPYVMSIKANITEQTVFVQTTVPTSLMLNANFIPEESETYDLGLEFSRWRTIYLSEQPDISSDIRLKKNISYDLTFFDNFVDLLRPAVYKMRNDKSEKTHFGLIAQDVEEALSKTELDPDMTAMLHKCKSGDDYLYSLSYGELHAIEIYEIQKLKQKIRLLEAKLKEKDNYEND